MTRLLGLSIALALLTACPAPPELEPDGGGDTGPDGGQGDGGRSCDVAPHDPVLGTAQLAPGFRLLDFAALPTTSWLPVAAVNALLPDAGLGLTVYGLAGDGRVHRLGLWPQLEAPSAANELFDAVAPEDRALQVLVTPALATTQGRLLAGYRTVRSGGFVDGGAVLFDTNSPDTSGRWFAAPGLESALGLGSFFLAGGDGLGAAGGARGVYAAPLNGDPPRLVARYPVVAGETVRPGPMAVTANGVVVLGHALDLAGRHSLRLPAPALLEAALGGGAPVDLAGAPELTAADDVQNVVGIGHGVAVLHTQKVRGVLPALGRLEHYPLSRNDAGTAVGAPLAMLSADDDGCTAVSQFVPVTGGLSVIVGLWDKNGQRLVRLAPR